MDIALVGREDRSYKSSNQFFKSFWGSKGTFSKKSPWQGQGAAPLALHGDKT
jgi:hypothetical protein